MASFLDRAKANATRVSGTAKPSQIIEATVLDIRPTRQVVKMSNGTELKKVMLITKEWGTFFPFENAINMQISSFGDGVKAKLTLQENDYKDSQGVEVEGLNCTWVSLEVIDSKTEAAIRMLPKGASLFGAF